MNNAKFTINLDFKGRNDLEKIIEQIGKEHNIPVNVDISKAEIGVLQNLNKPFKEAYESVRHFTSQLGLAISGVQQIYAAADKIMGSFVRAAQDAESADMALRGSFRATGLEVDINAQKVGNCSREEVMAVILAFFSVCSDCPKNPKMMIKALQNHQTQLSI